MQRRTPARLRVAAYLRKRAEYRRSVAAKWADRRSQLAAEALDDLARFVEQLPATEPTCARLMQLSSRRRHFEPRRDGTAEQLIRHYGMSRATTPENALWNLIDAMEADSNESTEIRAGLDAGRPELN